MSVRSPRFFSWWTQDRVSQYGIIVFVGTITSRRVGCGCTEWSFTTLGECGLSLSLGQSPMKTHSSNQEMKNN